MSILKHTGMKAREVLRKVPVFNGLEKNELEKILPLLEEEHFEADDYIIREGSLGDSMYIISEGSVRVLKAVNADEQMAINHMHRDAYFGELALIDNLPRSASIVTNERSRVLRLKKKVLDDLLRENPEIASTFYRNCLMDTFSRYRKITSDFTHSKYDLREKSLTLAELSKDLSSAKKLQDFFINTRTLDYQNFHIPGLRQSYVYNPCQEIGGDFINLMEAGHQQYGLIIADVMGHGITAALATGALKSAFSIMVKDAAENPTLLLASLNNHFFKDISSLFASCLYAFIDMRKKEITLARAGHYFPVFFSAEKNDLIPMDLKGPALGIKKHAHYSQEIYPVRPGDKILLFTDGVIEQKNLDGEMYSEKRLRNLFLDLSRKNEKDILISIENDLNQYASMDKKDDDITLLLLEFDG